MTSTELELTDCRVRVLLRDRPPLPAVLFPLLELFTLRRSPLVTSGAMLVVPLSRARQDLPLSLSFSSLSSSHSPSCAYTPLVGAPSSSVGCTGSASGAARRAAGLDAISVMVPRWIELEWVWEWDGAGPAGVGGNGKAPPGDVGDWARDSECEWWWLCSPGEMCEFAVLNEPTEALLAWPRLLVALGANGSGEEVVMKVKGKSMRVERQKKQSQVETKTNQKTRQERETSSTRLSLFVCFVCVCVNSKRVHNHPEKKQAKSPGAPCAAESGTAHPMRYLGHVWAETLAVAMPVSSPSPEHCNAAPAPRKLVIASW